MSDSSIMSVREMIDSCFGDSDINVVNFKLMQTILYLLAKQLRLLERQVAIEIGTTLVPRTSSISIREVKLKASIAKKKKKLTKTANAVESGITSSKSKADKNKGKASFSSTTDKTATSSITADKVLPLKSINEPITLDKLSRSTTEKKTNPIFEKSTIDKTTTLKPISETSISDKTTVEAITHTTTSLESSELYMSDKITSKSGMDKITSRKPTTEKSILEKIATDKSTASEFMSMKSTLSTDKSKSSKEESSKGTSDEPINRKPKKTDYHLLLEHIEQQREQELRVVNQRADSREVGNKTPTPMASLDSIEVQYEKLLVVERVPIEEAEKKIGRLREDKLTKLNVVTQNKFDDLAQEVKELQIKFGLVGKADFPENIQLMQDLRRGASLTDAMAALQISARLESVEKTLKVMEILITDIGAKKDFKIKEKQEGKVQYIQKRIDIPKTSVIYGTPSGQPNISGVFGESRNMPIYTHSESLLKDGPIPSGNNINMAELEDAMQELYGDLTKTVGMLTNNAIITANDALKTARTIEAKLDVSIDVDTRMKDLETLVSAHMGQINALDANLTSQMTNYQEQLTQMQHDLEGGLECMAEALANPPEEATGAAELNENFSNLQIQFDLTNMRQKDLEENQSVLSLDVQNLWKEIELLREIKSDRDEVADALRDKAGLGELNGLVTQQQFDAVRGDLEQRIVASYDKFNNQEIVWQKIIDDLLRELNEKADYSQVVSLRDDINNNIEKLQTKIRKLMEVIGEPHAAAISKRLFRDAACLSCSTPAQMNLEEPTLPALPAFSKPSSRPLTIAAEDTSIPKQDGDHGVCYPGLQVQHPRDERSYVCRRYCGGHHTVDRGMLSRGPAEMAISSLRRATTGLGSDGKVYLMDEQKIETPCGPCNVAKAATPQVSITDKDSRCELESDTAQFYVLPAMIPSVEHAADNISVTPPLPHDDDYD